MTTRRDPGRVRSVPPSGKKRWRIAVAGLLLAGLCVLLPGLPPARAGTPAFGVPRFFGTSVDDSRSVAVGDLDGDGDLDLVVGNHSWAGEQNWVYLNDGDGNYDWPGAGRKLGPGTDSTTSVALGDVDGDGYLDVVVGNAGQFDAGEHNAVYLNDGTAHFPISHTLGTETEATYAVALGDVDHDGDLDAVIGNTVPYGLVWGINRIYLNNGDGTFNPTSDPFGTGTDPTESLALGDTNGDGHLDIVLGNTYNRNVVYFNDGGGSFHYDPVDGATDCYTPSSEYRCFAPFAGGTESVVLGDMNDDGHLDIVVGNNVQNNNPNALYLNDSGGTGDFYMGPVDCTAPPANVRCFSTVDDLTYSAAVGDVNGDGHLDAVFGNYEEQKWVYVNDGAGDFPTSLPVGTGPARTYSVALADTNDDGHLDVVVGNMEQNVIHLNNGKGEYAEAQSSGDQADPGYSNRVVLGDMDGDGDLDIVEGNYFYNDNRVYTNDGGGGFALSDSFAPLPFNTTSDLELGDLDGDDDLDVALGTLMLPNHVFLNDGAGSFGWLGGDHPIGSSSESTMTMDIALGDVDADGDLDLVVANYSQTNRLHLNDGSGNFPTAYSFGPISDTTQCVALGDVDGDGHLDIAVGNVGYETGEPNVIYLNDGTGGFFSGNVDCADPPENAHCFGTGWDRTHDLALGDLDGDGDLDIAVANSKQPNAVLLNDGNGVFSPGGHFGTGSDQTHGVALGDVDGDGDLDIIAANFQEQNVVYLNDGTGQFDSSSPTREFGTGTDRTVSVAVGDLNGDGAPEILAGNSGTGAEARNWIYVNRSRLAKRLPNNLPYLTVTRPGSSAVADDYSTPEILGNRFIAVPHTLFDADGDQVGRIVASYSPDGGGHWLPAVAMSGTMTTSLPASPGGTIHTFTWDTYESGFFGRSDNVVLRFEAYPTLYPQSYEVPAPFQWPYATATTFPFRVRGTQVRVLSGTTPISNALVYRVEEGQSFGQAIANNAGRPYRTDLQGYLQGHGELKPGDGLVALLPISATGSYTLYVTSAAPTSAGLEVSTVAQAGVQTLTVTPDNPLLLLNLDVSLEWDARYDSKFVSRLEFDLQRTSEYLYDWTDGQTALGRVRVYHDHQNWLSAHVRIYASNRLRPNAAQGGITSALITDTDNISLTYAPGQVHMAPTWNRYGDPGAGLGEDWPRTLAHELGHYAFFLDDNYLGLDPSGLLVPVDGCSGAMSDPYRKDYPYDEFHKADGWLPACEETLSNQSSGRSDWATITTFYPALSAYSTITNTGPAGLPLAVTQIRFVEPVSASTSLDDPTFYLSQDGQRVEPGAGARAVLFWGDQLTDMGRPTLNHVLARGASPGERLCVYDIAAGRLGCEEITPIDEQMELFSFPDWQPDLIISPVNSRTIALTVTNVPTQGLSLQARIYPATDPAPPSITLVLIGDGYAGTFNLAAPALEGHVHVWVDEPDPRREIISDYSIGGNPGMIRGRWGSIRGRWGMIRGRWAPAVSADGQVILFGDDLHFGEGEFFTLQAATFFTGTPPWATVVGQAYRLSASPNAPDLTGASLAIRYMGNEVPPGEEDWLRVYYQAPFSTTWQMLPTALDTDHNNASAAPQGEGLYVLMSSIEIPLYGPGWNLFAYPVAETRPVVEALLSISGAYTTVYGYDASDHTDPWAVYDVTVPDWVNDLDVLEFGHGYWLNATEAITLYLKGASSSTYSRGVRGGFPSPPATYFGTVAPSSYFTASAGLSVTAWIDGRLCGQGSTLDDAGQIVYVVDVLADDGEGAAGCGAEGRLVSFRVDGQAMAPPASWSNRQLWNWPLGPIAAPLAGDDTATTPEDTAVSITVLTNDTDPDGDSLTVTAAGPAAHGSVGSDGLTVFYTPTLDFNGIDAFPYTVRDPSGLTDTATVSITVTPVNDPPVAVDDTAATPEDTPVEIAVLSNDTDPDLGDALAVLQVGPPAQGSVGTDGLTVFYTPTLDFNGIDAFSYTVRDLAGFTDTATVTVTVGPVNDAPEAADDAAVTAEDTPVSIAVLANDSDPENDTLSVVAVGLPGSGVATLSAAGVTYTPTLDFNGTDAFSYTVADTSGLTDTATVSVTVTPVNDAPTIGPIPDQVTTEGVPAGPIPFAVGDVETPAGTLSLSLASSNPALVAPGSVAFGGSDITRTAILTPSAGLTGTALLTITVHDGEGAAASESFTLTVLKGPPCHVYLPSLYRAYAPPAPDLVVERIDVEHDNLTLVVRNQGTVSVTAAFWVDVYIDPNPVPTAANQTWNDLAPQGLVWAVDAPALPLGPGEVITLSVGDPFYRTDLSQCSWPLAPGTPIYAQVDSYNPATSYGAVLEDHETRGGPYNNIAGPVFAPAYVSEGAGVIYPAAGVQRPPFRRGQAVPA